MPSALRKELQKDDEPLSHLVRPIIFTDYDDTILCSSGLSRLGLSLRSDLSTLSPEVLLELSHLERCALAVISLAKELGDLCIVTNAELGWVEMSSQKFLPKVALALQNVPIISARHHFEQRNPNNPTMWKFDAFYGLLSSFPLAPRHIVSFGDSRAERDAVLAAAKHFDGSVVKNVKFAEKPSIQHLVHQLELAARFLPSIVEHAGPMDLALRMCDASRGWKLDAY